MRKDTVDGLTEKGIFRTNSNSYVDSNTSDSFVLLIGTLLGRHRHSSHHGRISDERGRR